jgi:hypothetical protein
MKEPKGILEYLRGINMPDKEIEPIYLATKEGRELHRIRQSFTFNLGIQVMKIFKNPLKLIVFPYHLLALIIGRKNTVKFSYQPKSDYLVIGIDKTGEFYSTKALGIAKRLQSALVNDVTLISNSQTGPKENNQIQWFRLPAARENNYSRKEWNISIERLLSTALSLCKPRKIIFFGDYLYRGIINSLEGVDEDIPQFWFFSDYPDSTHLENLKYNRIRKMCIPSESTSSQSAVSQQARFSNDDMIFVVDLDINNHHIYEILQAYPDSKIMAIQRGDRLPLSISDSTISVSEMSSITFRKGVFFIIDESSRIVPELASLEIPGLLLLGKKIDSPILAEMVSNLELYRDLVVARRLENDDIEQSISYMVTRNINHNLKRERDDYVVKWLNSTDKE